MSYRHGNFSRRKGKDIAVATLVAHTITNALHMRPGDCNVYASNGPIQRIGDAKLEVTGCLLRSTRRHAEEQDEAEQA